MSRLWVKVIHNHKIVRHDAIECALGEEKDRLTQLLQQMDIPTPMWLDKHEREFDDFKHTWFLKEHFVEDVPFDKLEVEFLYDDGVKRRSRDPRNDFS